MLVIVVVVIVTLARALCAMLTPLLFAGWVRFVVVLLQKRGMDGWDV